MVTDVNTVTPQCGARIGYVAGEWQETPVWCATTVGLTEYQDDHGVARWYCRHHKAETEHRYPRAKAPEACTFCGDTAAIVDGRYVLVTFGGRLRVVCDDCYSKADEPDDDEPEFDREGQPEFSGQFR